MLFDSCVWRESFQTEFHFQFDLAEVKKIIHAEYVIRKFARIQKFTRKLEKSKKHNSIHFYEHVVHRLGELGSLNKPQTSKQREAARLLCHSSGTMRMTIVSNNKAILHYRFIN